MKETPDKAKTAGAPRILVDADACPVKLEVYRVAKRYRLDVTLVANARMRVPDGPGITLEVVSGSPDAADDWIALHAGPRDIVVTSDIPLASRCIKAGARVISPAGKPFTEDNIGQSVAMRDLLSELRGAGQITGGPPPLNQRDRSQFLQRLDDAVQSVRSSRFCPCRRLGEPQEQPTVSGEGTVTRLLPDDNKGSRHQRV